MGIIEDMTKKLTEQAAATAAKKSAGATAEDVDAELARIAAAKGGKSNYKTSIVDLLKLLDMDSSLTARKKLAEELGVNAGPHGSAEQNIALHKAVMARFGQQQGKLSVGLRQR